MDNLHKATSGPPPRCLIAVIVVGGVQDLTTLTGLIGRLDGFSKGCLLLPSAQAKGLLVVKLGLGQLQLLAPDLVARAFPSSITQEIGGLDVPFMA